MGRKKERKKQMVMAADEGPFFVDLELVDKYGWSRALTSIYYEPYYRHMNVQNKTKQTYWLLDMARNCTK
jgi:hypothetical protein